MGLLSGQIGRIVVACASAGFLAAPSPAGDLVYKGGNWEGFSGSAASRPQVYTAKNDEVGRAPSLKLTSPKAKDDFTLQGSYNFSVTWYPKKEGEKPPKHVIVTFQKMATMSADAGVAKILEGKKELARLDHDTTMLSGATTALGTVKLTLKLQKQKDGTYVAKGRLRSDMLSTTFGKESGIVTSCEEAFAMFDLQEGK
ncbi:MAG TPA: hypothetical protein VHE55_15860 [Fimbriimonadaceae bacterium]|nr:hypothetical protein [Fimbriimonadaceae bacterium]